jgi:hypothetical protein
LAEVQAAEARTEEGVLDLASEVHALRRDIADLRRAQEREEVG